VLNVPPLIDIFQPLFSPNHAHNLPTLVGGVFLSIFLTLVANEVGKHHQQCAKQKLIEIAAASQPRDNSQEVLPVFPFSHFPHNPNIHTTLFLRAKSREVTST